MRFSADTASKFVLTLSLSKGEDGSTHSI